MTLHDRLTNLSERVSVLQHRGQPGMLPVKREIEEVPQTWSDARRLKKKALRIYKQKAREKHLKTTQDIKNLKASKWKHMQSLQSKYRARVADIDKAYRRNRIDATRDHKGWRLGDIFPKLGWKRLPGRPKGSRSITAPHTPDFDDLDNMDAVDGDYEVIHPGSSTVSPAPSYERPPSMGIPRGGSGGTILLPGTRTPRKIIVEPAPRKALPAPSVIATPRQIAPPHGLPPRQISAPTNQPRGLIGPPSGTVPRGLLPPGPTARLMKRVVSKLHKRTL